MLKLFHAAQIKAIHPIAEEVTAKMIKFIKQEIHKDGFNGFDAKDVSFTYAHKRSIL